MTDPHHLQGVGIVEHHGYQIRLSPTDLDGLRRAPSAAPDLILAPDREAVVATAYERIEHAHKSAKSSS